MKPDNDPRGPVELRSGRMVQSTGLKPTPTGTNMGHVYQCKQTSEDASSREIKVGAEGSAP